MIAADGTVHNNSTYTHGGCRCDDCRNAHATVARLTNQAAMRAMCELRRRHPDEYREVYAGELAALRCQDTHARA